MTKKIPMKPCDMAADDDILEILDRVRRIETMLFKVAMALNINPRTGGTLSNEPKKLE